MWKMPPEEVALLVFESSLAVSLLGLFGKPGMEDDQMVVDCHEMVLDAISDADATSKVECRTGENWRDQLTVEEVEDIRRDADLRRMWNRN